MDSSRTRAVFEPSPKVSNVRVQVQVIDIRVRVQVLKNKDSSPTPLVFTHPQHQLQVIMLYHNQILLSSFSFQGTKAWRNDQDGSWYIHHLCEVLKKYHERDHFMDMLVMVNSEVAKRESSDEAAKQMPCIVSTFTKRFYLGQPNTNN